MTWTLELPGVLPDSMNVRERSSHWKRAKELADLTVLIGATAKALRIPPAKGRRAVTVTIHKSLRSRVTDDPANRDSRAKSLLDAMVATGLLRDDSDRWLEWRHVHEGERMRMVSTVIEISDVTNEQENAA